MFPCGNPWKPKVLAFAFKDTWRMIVLGLHVGLKQLEDEATTYFLRAYGNIGIILLHLYVSIGKEMTHRWCTCIVDRSSSTGDVRVVGSRPIGVAQSWDCRSRLVVPQWSWEPAVVVIHSGGDGGVGIRSQGVCSCLALC